MKKLSLIMISTMLISCTNSSINVIPSVSNSPAIPANVISSPTNNQTNQDNFIYPQLIKEIETKLGDQGISGISNDILGNTYIFSSYGKIIMKINRLSNTLEYVENDDKENYFPSVPNLFFHIDSKGNGYFIPAALVIDSLLEDPVTKKIKGYTDNKFSIYKINNLKITDKYLISIQDFRFKSYCLSTDDCSDLYLNVGNKNYSLNEFLKSKKEYIENDDLRSNIFGSKNVIFNSSGNGFYIGGINNKVYIYSFINGISKKTDIPLPLSSDYDLSGDLDSLGNGYLINYKDGVIQYYKVNEYVIEQEKDLENETAKSIYRSLYTSINNEGNGFIIYSDNTSYNFSKINNFKVDDKKEFLIEVNDIYVSKKLISVDLDGNGYLAFNKFLGVDSSGLRSKFKPIIFVVRNYNLIK